MRALSAAAAVLLLSGCLPFHLWHKDRQRDPALDRKAVITKEEPTSLIAADGSRCLVGEDKYAHTDIGDRVWCVWSAKDGRKTAYSGLAQDAPPGQRREPGSGESDSGKSGWLHIFGWP
jgi:hypothetical protein